MSKSLQAYLSEDVPSQSGAVPITGLVPVAVDGVLYVATPDEIEGGIATGPTGPAGPAGDAHVAEYPPTYAARGAGQLWLIPSLGHSALWSGTAWVAQTPTDPEANLCCIIGAFPIWFDAAQYDGSTPWENLNSGGTAYDAAISGSTTGTDGDGNEYVDFDGTDDDASIPDGSEWTYTTSDPLTILSIAKLNTVTANRQIFGLRTSTVSTSSTGGPGIIINASSKPAFRFQDGAAGGTAVAVATADATDIHLYVGERSITADAVRIVVDGDYAGIVSATDSSTATSNVSIPARIGRSGGAGSPVYTDMNGYVFGTARRTLTETEHIVLGDWLEERFL
jgi:hypothetical protein